MPRAIKTLIHEMVGDMSKDNATAVAELREVVEYARNLLDVLAPDQSDCGVNAT
jgi:hypothetical protein